MRRFAQTMMIACLVLMAASLAGGVPLARAAAATPSQVCQKRLYLAKAKYDACEAKATAAFISPVHVLRFQKALARCHVKYGETWARLRSKAKGTGTICDNPRYGDNGDGTVTDHLTGLQWEQKTDDAGIHDKDDFYPWSAGGKFVTAADGPAYTDFLATLNGGTCFAGQCDWRLPTRGELQTILLEGYPCATSPCIDQVAFGPTDTGSYWSSTTSAADERVAWNVYFADGFVLYNDAKDSNRKVRAVRAGL